MVAQNFVRAFHRGCFLTVGMTIWILALVLFLSLAGAGYKQGAIRVAFSLVGLIFAALLAVPLGHLLFPMLAKVGLKNPAIAAFVAPVSAFVLILIIFKAAGLAVHRKVDVHYKYHAGDLRAILFERLNRRLGLCLGLLNALVYLLLISVLVYTMSYWTTQMSTSENNSFAVQTLNRLGKDLGTNSSGFVSAVRPIDPATDRYYDAADIVGIIYHNPLIDARLSRYPGFLSLAEKQEFQDLANDKEFTAFRQGQPSLLDFIKHTRVKAIIENPQLLHEIWTTMTGKNEFLKSDALKDLKKYLITGQSDYDSEKILGRWIFDVNAAISALKKIKPNMSAVEVKRMRQFFDTSYGKSLFVAAPNHEAFLKNVPQLKQLGTPNFNSTETLHAQWKKIEEDKYQLTVTGKESEEVNAMINNEKLVVQGGAMGLVFERED